MAKLVTGRHEIVALRRLLARHHRRRGLEHLHAGRSGYGPAQRRLAWCCRRPTAYRSRFIDADGATTGDIASSTSASSWSTASRPARSRPCIAEPILSSGGVLEPPVGYLAALPRSAASAACC